MSKEISRPTSTALGKRSRAEIVGSQDDKKNKKETGSPSSRDEAPENGQMRAPTAVAERAKRAKKGEIGSVAEAGQIKDETLNYHNQTSETSNEAMRAASDEQLGRPEGPEAGQRTKTLAPSSSRRGSSARPLPVQASGQGLAMAAAIGQGRTDETMMGPVQPGVVHAPGAAGSFPPASQRIDTEHMSESCAQDENAAKLQNDYRTNRSALKRIRKLSEWFVKQRSFRAENMRKHLGELISKRHQDRLQNNLQPHNEQQQRNQTQRRRQNGATNAAGNGIAGTTATGKPRANRKKQDVNESRDQIADSEQSCSIGGGLPGGAGKSGQPGGSERRQREAQNEASNESSMQVTNRRAGKQKEPKSPPLKAKDAAGTENSKYLNGEEPEQSCFNRFGCPYNMQQQKHLQTKLAQGEISAVPGKLDAAKQSSVVSTKKTKFIKVTRKIDNQVISFCEYCYKCYKDNDKCDWCDQVYFSNALDGDVDGETWIGCDNCEKWNHPLCEIEHGKDPIQKAAAQELYRMETGGAQDPADAAQEGLAEDKKGVETPVKEESKEPTYYCKQCRKKKDSPVKQPKSTAKKEKTLKKATSLQSSKKETVAAKDGKQTPAALSKAQAVNGKKSPTPKEDTQQQKQLPVAKKQAPVTKRSSRRSSFNVNQNSDEKPPTSALRQSQSDASPDKNVPEATPKDASVETAKLDVEMKDEQAPNKNTKEALKLANANSSSTLIVENQNSSPKKESQSPAVEESKDNAEPEVKVTPQESKGGAEATKPRPKAQESKTTVETPPDEDSQSKEDAAQGGSQEAPPQSSPKQQQMSQVADIVV